MPFRLMQYPLTVRPFLLVPHFSSFDFVVYLSQPALSDYQYHITWSL